MGFDKIILVGQDLAYIEGQCYSKDSVYKDLIIQFNKENDREDLKKLAKGMSLCSNATVDEGLYGDPTEIALGIFAENNGYSKINLDVEKNARKK